MGPVEPAVSVKRELRWIGSLVADRLESAAGAPRSGVIWICA